LHFCTSNQKKGDLLLLFFKTMFRGLRLVSTRLSSLGVLSTAARHHQPSTDAPPPKPPTKEEIDRLVAALEADDALLEGIVSNLQPDTRRHLAVVGGAMEWFGKDSVAMEMERADPDKDRLISPKDFDNWFSYALKRKADEAAAIAGSAPGQPCEKTSDAQVPLAALLIIALEAGLPFVGFGFLDNATMILAGDAIDHTVGFYLNCSVMASAAMGNVVSGVCGMQVHGLVEKAVHRLNLNIPILTEEQRKGRRVFLAGHMGGTFGIMIGLTLGMLPLLVIHTDAEAKTDVAVFKKWDVNKSNSLDPGELVSGLREIGFGVDEVMVNRVIKHYSDTGKLNCEQFRALCIDLRQHRHAPHAA
jgi:hypothetical protein